MDQFNKLLDFLEAHPVFYPLVIWPVLTGLVSFGQDAIKARAPRLWDALQKSGLDLLGILRFLLKLLGKRVPPMPVLFTFIACTIVLCGCGAQEKLVKAVEASRDIAAFAEPCLVEAQKVALAKCDPADKSCPDDVYAAFKPMADALDLLHDAWCSISPSSEGCAK